MELFAFEMFHGERSQFREPHSEIGVFPFRRRSVSDLIDLDRTGNCLLVIIPERCFFARCCGYLQQIVVFERLIESDIGKRNQFGAFRQYDSSAVDAGQTFDSHGIDPVAMCGG